MIYVVQSTMDSYESFKILGYGEEHIALDIKLKLHLKSYTSKYC